MMKTFKVWLDIHESTTQNVVDELKTVAKTGGVGPDDIIDLLAISPSPYLSGADSWPEMIGLVKKHGLQNVIAAAKEWQKTHVNKPWTPLPQKPPTTVAMAPEVAAKMRAAFRFDTE